VLVEVLFQCDFISVYVAYNFTAIIYIDQSKLLVLG